MTEIEPGLALEKKFGVRRRLTVHLGLVDTREQRFYILHSKDCIDSGIDLRECEYSLSLDVHGAVYLSQDQYLMNKPFILRLLPDGRIWPDEVVS